MAFDGFKGPDNVDEQNIIDSQSDISNISQSIESEQIGIEPDQNTAKNDLNSLKQEIFNENLQLNNKIDEIIDTFTDLSKKQLIEEQKQELRDLLLSSSKKSNSPKKYLGDVLLYIRESTEKTTIEDFKDIILILSEEEEITEKAEEVSKKTKEISEVTEEEVVNQSINKNKKGDLKEKNKQSANKENIVEGEVGIGIKTLDKLNRSNINIIKLIRASKGLDLKNEQYGNIIERIQNLDLDNLDNDVLKDILEKLKSPQVLISIRDDLEKQGGGGFKVFESALIGIDSSFRETFDNLPSIEGKAMILLGVKSLDGVDISRNVLKKMTDDGFELEAGKDGRRLSIVGSNYKMDGSINNSGEVKRLLEVEKSYKDKISGLNETLNSVAGIMRYVDETIVNNADIEEVKKAIQAHDSELYNQLNLAGATSLSNIKQQLGGLYRQVEEEKDEILEERQELLDDLVSQNAEKAKNLDKRKKETLKFLDSIGFDELPQDATNDIIETINNGSGKGVYGFRNKIDLANGNLGTNLDGDINSLGIAEKKFFAEFMNILLSGEKGKPINIDTMETGVPIFMDSNGERVVDKDAYIKKLVGINAKGFMLQNIKKFKEGIKKETN